MNNQPTHQCLCGALVELYTYKSAELPDMSRHDYLNHPEWFVFPLFDIPKQCILSFEKAIDFRKAILIFQELRLRGLYNSSINRTTIAYSLGKILDAGWKDE